MAFMVVWRSDMYGKEYLEWREADKTSKSYLELLNWHINNSNSWFSYRIYGLGHNAGLKLARSLYEINLHTT